MRKPLRWIIDHRVAVGNFVAGGLAATAVALGSAQLVEETGDEHFCGSCHEMDIFCDQWREGPHGPGKKGIASATCVDCHLPHGNVVSYLAVKAKSGAIDVSSHIRGHEPDWVENLEHREDYTYESGCLKCHVELVAPEISLKAYMAHRDVLTGETTETCISCHHESGHGKLKQKLLERAAAEDEG